MLHLTILIFVLFLEKKKKNKITHSDHCLSKPSTANKSTFENCVFGKVLYFSEDDEMFHNLTVVIGCFTDLLYFPTLFDRHLLFADVTVPVIWRHFPLDIDIVFDCMKLVLIGIHYLLGIYSCI